MDAVVFVRDCGATTSWSTQVSLVDKGDSIGQRGNLFIVDDGGNDVERNAAMGPLVSVRWQGSDRLVIKYATGSEMFRKKSEYGDVEIAYRQLPDAP